jgi:hypothetical protein
MRAHTITTKSRRRAKAWRRALALTLAICALAIPASASADPDPAPDGYATPNAIIGGSSGSGGSSEVGSGYSSPTAIAGPLPDRFTVESPAVEPPASTGDGFDWASAAVGAGSALALVALGGAALLTVRRRAAVSPSPPAS